MRKFSFVILFLVPMVIYCQSIDDVKNLISQGEYNQAIELGNKLYNNDSTNIDLLSQIASAKYQAGKYAASKLDYHKLEKISPDTTSIFNSLMKIYEVEQNYPLAVKYATKMARIKSNQPYYTRKLSDYFVASGYTYEGLKIMRQAHQIDTNDVQTALAFGELCYKNNLVETADTISVKALAKEPDYIGLRSLVAKIAMRIKQYDKAITHLEFIRSRSNLSSFQNRNLGFAYLQKDSINKAINFLETSIRKGENMEYNYYYLAMAHAKNKNTIKAKEYYEMAIKESYAENISTYYQDLANIYAEEKNYTKAQDLMALSFDVTNEVENIFLQAYYLEQSSNKPNKECVKLYEAYIKACNEKCTNRAFAEKRVKALRSAVAMKN